ncbi:DUF1611 domain-containing protein [Fulvivirga sp. M361]|uniref:DUF1611 domain-containing protein n=1 Tax=Fulvivirga sp. M361 TaxID=2594266 RepID=UPI00117BDA7D|nr:DUF1611 domain-containing protein [Fulvivirga sp. M361]TRX53013.1 DUF1611 domain-containing protein [Fulvivirga sp. M361]
MTDKLNQNAVTGTACIITGGLLNDVHAKTAHGLIRQSDRFQILGVLDHISAGEDAGMLLDGKHRNIPVFHTIEQLIGHCGQKPDYAIIGMATKGGVLPEELYPLVKQTLEMGISLVNGLHETIGDIEEFSAVAKQGQSRILDIRKPKGFKDLHFWTGKIKEVKALKLAVLGTDCALGKRTTTKFLVNELKEHGCDAHMVYTGQTGWLQGGQYGFVFDATPNDFISGELEHSVCQCWEKEDPDVILLEGQSSLRNPSGPCGSEYIISCELDGVILQHAPGRTYFNGLEKYGKPIPTIEEEIALIKMLGTDTICITLNSEGLTPKEAQNIKNKIEQELGIPTVLPLEEGMNRCAATIKQMMHKKKDVVPVTRP